MPTFTTRSADDVPPEHPGAVAVIVYVPASAYVCVQSREKEPPYVCVSGGDPSPQSTVTGSQSYRSTQTRIFSSAPTGTEDPSEGVKIPPLRSEEHTPELQS